MAEKGWQQRIIGVCLQPAFNPHYVLIWQGCKRNFLDKGCIRAGQPFLF